MNSLLGNSAIHNSKFLVSNLLAGLTSGIVTLVYSLSFAALIFSGNLASYFPQGVGTAIIGATVTAILVAVKSPFRFTLAGPEANSAIIIALATSAIATQSLSMNNPDSLYPTAWGFILLSSFVTGVSLYFLGRFRLGRWARFIPYPVIGGFLAGTGWLITRSSFKVMSGYPLVFSELPHLLQSESICHWASGSLFAIVLFFILGRFKHFLVLPSLLAGGIFLGNLTALIYSLRDSSFNRADWFFNEFPRAELWKAWKVETIQAIDWHLILQQSNTLAAMVVIVMLSILLNSTGLELATSQNVDLDEELKANGIANMVNGLFGGMVGYLSINRCLLNRQAGASSPLAAIFAGSLCGTVLLWGGGFLTYIPKPILGGLLLYIGTNLLVRWVYQSYQQIPRADYALILLILNIIAFKGFLEGVAVGVIIACLLFIFSYVRTSNIKYTLTGCNFQSNKFRSYQQRQFLQEQGRSVYILVLHGFVFFGTANELMDKIKERMALTHIPQLKYVVLDFHLVTGLDTSAVLSLLKLKQLSEKTHLTLVFTNINPNMEAQLKKGGLFVEDEPQTQRFADLDHGVEWCENQLLDEFQHLTLPKQPMTVQLRTFMESGLENAEQLFTYLNPVQLEQGEYLFKEGDTSDGLYFLETGQVSIVKELANGKLLRRRTYTDGTVLGEMGFYAKSQRSATVIADHPSRMYFLSNRVFQRMEEESPRLVALLNKGVVNLLAERLRRSEDEIMNILQ